MQALEPGSQRISGPQAVTCSHSVTQHPHERRSRPTSRSIRNLFCNRRTTQGVRRRSLPSNAGSSVGRGSGDRRSPPEDPSPIGSTPSLRSGGDRRSPLLTVKVRRERPKRVTIKVLREEALREPELRGRFQREARAAAKLGNEHIARVSDVGELENGAPCMVMEYLEGEDLAAHLHRSGILRQMVPLAQLQLQHAQGQQQDRDDHRQQRRLDHTPIQHAPRREGSGSLTSAAA